VASDRRQRVQYSEEQGAAVAQGLHKIAVDLFAGQGAMGDEFLSLYCGGLREPAGSSKLTRHTIDLLRVGGVDVRGKKVLDVGCGFGFALVICGLLGASELHGIEIHEGMMRTIESYRHLLPEDVRRSMHVGPGDAADMRFASESFDLVLSVEAISHYLDVERFIGEAARVLRPGGVLVISDGNNGVNPWIRRRNHRVWAAFEQGPSDAVVEGHPIGTCFEELRLAFIEAGYPTLPRDDCARLARETFAMTYEQIAEACDTFCRSGESPGREFEWGALPVAPEGFVNERLFNPRSLARVLGRHGMEARAYGYWGGANGNRLLRGMNSAFMRVSPGIMWSARAFRVAGVKSPSGG
jgi:SAM-dependent methyltransferase